MDIIYREYTYNKKISKRANERLQKRARSMRRRRQAAALIALLAVLSAILIGCGSRARAGGRAEQHRYYTSIRVQRGDTLWELAKRYAPDMDRQTFIDEVSAINGIRDGRLRSGEYIVVTYYAEE